MRALVLGCVLLLLTGGAATCPPGTYDESGTCRTCASGTFSNASGSTACLHCPVGRWSLNPSPPSNFDDGAVDGWSCGAITTCGDYGKICGGYGVTGQGAVIEKTYVVVPGTYTVKMDFVKIDTWDGEQGEVLVNDVVCWTSKAWFPSDRTERCGAYGYGEDKAAVSCTVNVPGTRLHVQARATIDDGAMGESFAIDNVLIDGLPGPTACAPADHCAPGTFNDPTSPLCKACPAHHFQAAAQQSHCDACPAGWYSYDDTSTGQTSGDQMCCPFDLPQRSSWPTSGLPVTSSSSSSASLLHGQGCVLDGRGQRRVLDASGSGLSLIIRNITIRNGKTTASGSDDGGGAGLRIAGASGIRNVTVSSCTFAQNEAFGQGGRGGGIFVSGAGSTATVEACLFQGNQADVSGAGIGIYDGSRGAVTGCTFVGNNADGVVLLSAGKTMEMSSKLGGGVASICNDGNVNGPFHCHTGSGENQWLSVDLGRTASLSFVRIYPRTLAMDNQYVPGVYFLEISSDNATWTECNTVDINEIKSVFVEACRGTAQYVRIRRKLSGYIILYEFQVFGSPISGGGAIDIAGASTVSITDCTMRGNTIAGDANVNGSAIVAVGSNVTISNVHVFLPETKTNTSSTWPAWYSQLIDVQNTNLEPVVRQTILPILQKASETCVFLSNASLPDVNALHSRAVQLANIPDGACTSLLQSTVTQDRYCVATTGQTCRITDMDCKDKVTTAVRGTLGPCQPSGQFDGHTACVPPEQNCSVGKRLVRVGNTTTSTCQTCRNGAGFWCPGDTLVALRCHDNGAYCPNSSTTPRLPCPRGWYCRNSSVKEACRPGTFGPEAGQTRKEGCLACPARYYSGNAHADCIICPDGRFCDKSRCSGEGIRAEDLQNADYDCPARYTCTGGMATLCKNNSGGTCCPGNTGHPMKCSPGKYQNRPTQAACEACPTGLYAGTNGTFACTACPTGHVQNIKGTSVCKACAMGKVQLNTGQTECGICDCRAKDPNLFDGLSGNCACSISCSTCPPGTFESRPCASPEAFNDRECTSCPTSWYSSLNGTKSCLFCNRDNEYTPGAGASECTSCALNAKANKNKTSCVCDPHFFEVGFETRPRATTSSTECNAVLNKKRGCCADVPAGSSADSGRLLVRQGYWLKPETARTATPLLMLCPTQAACLGSESGSNKTCAEGHMGIICDTCEAEWRKGGIDGMCKHCPGAKTPGDVLSQLLSVSSLVIGAGLLVHLVRMASKRHRTAQKKNDAPAEQNPSKQAEGSKDDTSSTQAFMAQFFTLVSFAQVVSSFGYTFRASSGGDGAVSMSLPPDVLWICSALNIFTGDVLRLLSGAIPCSTSLPFAYRFASMLALMPLLLIIITLSHRIAICIVFPPKAIRKEQFDVVVQMTNTIIFFMWPTVSSAIVSVFAFTDVDGVYLLAGDLSIQLGSSAWIGLAIVGAAASVIIIIGIPAALFIVLKRRRHELTHALGMLFLKYEPQYWYFELVFMFYKFLMTSFVLVLQAAPLMQGLAAIIIAIVFSILLAHMQPYVDDSVDTVGLMGACSTWMLLILGSANTYWFQNVSPDSMVGVRTLISSLSMVAVIGSFLLPIGMMAWPKMQRVGEWCSRKAGTKSSVKVVPVAAKQEQAEEAAESGSRDETRGLDFDPLACTSVVELQTAYVKLKERHAALKTSTNATIASLRRSLAEAKPGHGSLKAMTRTRTVEESQSLRIRSMPGPRGRLKKQHSIAEREATRRHLTDEAHASLIIDEDKAEHAARQEQLAKDKQASAELGAHKRLLREIRHKARNKSLASTLFETLGKKGEDHTISFDDAVLLFEAIVERPLDRGVVEKSLARIDRDGDGMLNLDELRRVVGEKQADEKIESKESSDERS